MNDRTPTRTAATYPTGHTPTPDPRQVPSGLGLPHRANLLTHGHISMLTRASKSNRSTARPAPRTADDDTTPVTTIGGHDPYDTRWRDRADTLATFRHDHGRWPSAGSLEDDERSLGSWLRDQRRTARNPGAARRRWTPQRATYLDHACPGWDTERDDTWQATADAVARFTSEHTRWPSASHGQDEEERRLAWWLERQRHVLHTHTQTATTAEHAACLDRVCPGWHDRRAPAHTPWDDSADALSSFIARNDRWPGRTAPNPQERRLNLWLNSQRRAQRNGEPRLTTARTTYLDRVAPGWDQPTNIREDTWHRHADETITFRDTHHHWPSKTADDTTEKRLGTWLANQRQAARRDQPPRWTPERAAYLQHLAPGWRQP